MSRANQNYVRVNGRSGNDYPYDTSQGAWTQALPPITYPPYLCPKCGGEETEDSAAFCSRCLRETGKYYVLQGQPKQQKGVSALKKFIKSLSRWFWLCVSATKRKRT